MAKPVEIVLTGGPCAGKTTALRHLVEHLTGRGWRVLVVPEAATLLITGGLADIAHLSVNDRTRYLDVQRHLTQMQWNLRERFLALAADLDPDSKVVVLHDRAVLDNAAYMEPDEFRSVLRTALDLNPAQVRAHYDAVVHLVTAADGALDAYTLSNNEARTESPEAAVLLDQAVQRAWLGHSHLTVIPNTTVGGFDSKLTRVLAAVLNILGEPEPVEVERKWLLGSSPPHAFLERAEPVDIEQVYLPSQPGPNGPVERRVRARVHDDHAEYFHTTKAPLPGFAQGRVEHESRIDAETYRLLRGMQDAQTSTVHKRRYCFVHAGQHFELDHIQQPTDLWILEAELVVAGEPVTLPPELDIQREITDDASLRNAAIARRHTGQEPPKHPDLA